MKSTLYEDHTELYFLKHKIL